MENILLTRLLGIENRELLKQTLDHSPLFQIIVAAHETDVSETTLSSLDFTERELSDEDGVVRIVYRIELKNDGYMAASLKLENAGEEIIGRLSIEVAGPFMVRQIRFP